MFEGERRGARFLFVFEFQKCTWKWKSQLLQVDTGCQYINHHGFIACILAPAQDLDVSTYTYLPTYLLPFEGTFHPQSRQ